MDEHDSIVLVELGVAQVVSSLAVTLGDGH
jgi:hypothetical protein